MIGLDQKCKYIYPHYLPSQQTTPNEMINRFGMHANSHTNKKIYGTNVTNEVTTNKFQETFYDEMICL